MAEDFAGSAADAERIVCYCFCTYPLTGLRETDLMAHPTDTRLMTHFHLPLEAPRLITEGNQWVYQRWFCRLHEAYRRVTAAAAEIRDFEQSMETEIRHIEKTLLGAREGVKAMREAYDAEMQRAIEETRANSLYQWRPEPGSLSAFIWHFDGESLESLKMDFERSFPLRLSVESRIPSLQHCDLHIGPAQSELETLRTENAALRRELEAATEAMKIAQAARPIAAQEKAVASEPEKGVIEEGYSGASREVLGGRPVDMQEVPGPLQERVESAIPAQHEDAMSVFAHSAIERSLNEEGKFGKRPQISERKELAEGHNGDEENAIVKSSLDEAAQPLFEQRAQVICMRLGAEALPPADEFGPMGMGWIECLGVHQGKFAEAEEIINEAICGQRELTQNRGEELQAMSIKAALHFHRGQTHECLEMCEAVIEHYDPRYSEVHLTVVYFYTILANHGDAAEQEKLIQDWVSLTPEADSLFTLTLKSCIEGNVAFRQRRYWMAKVHLQEAQSHLEKLPPRPMLSAMNSFFLARVYCELKNLAKALELHAAAESCFAANFSESFWHAVNLSRMGEAFRCLKDNEKAIQVMKRAHEIFEKYFQSTPSYAENLTALAELHKTHRNAEIDYREKARTAYSEYRPTDIRAMQNLTRLGKLYGQRNHTFEVGKTLLLEAREALIRQCPVEAGRTLICLAKLHRRREYEVEARQYAHEAKEVLAPLDSKEARKALEQAEKVLDHLEKRRKREDN